MTTVLDIYNSGTDLEVITVVKSDTVIDPNIISCIKVKRFK
jgi:hypothetical protein